MIVHCLAPVNFYIHFGNRKNRRNISSLYVHQICLLTYCKITQKQIVRLRRLWNKKNYSNSQYLFVRLTNFNFWNMRGIIFGHWDFLLWQCSTLAIWHRNYHLRPNQSGPTATKVASIGPCSGDVATRSYRWAKHGFSIKQDQQLQWLLP